MTKQEYTEKLKDPRWQRKRLKIFTRDNWVCQSCLADDKTLHVHHKYYDTNADPWEYPEICLITLCDECHDSEKANLAEATKDLIDTLKRAGLTSHSVESLRQGIESISNIEDHENEWSIIRLIGGLRSAKVAP